MKYLVRNLKRLRKEGKLTQQQVAQVLGMHRSNYSKVENGERELSLEAIIKLADFFNMSVDRLVRRNPSTTNYPKLSQLLKDKASELDELEEEDQIAVYRVIEAMLQKP